MQKTRKADSAARGAARGRLCHRLDGDAHRRRDRHLGDRPGMDFTASGDPTQQDCVDEATNTTSYLLILERNGLLKHHTVGTPFSKENLLRGVAGWPHWTAVLKETATASAGRSTAGSTPTARTRRSSRPRNGTSPACRSCRLRRAEDFRPTRLGLLNLRCQQKANSWRGRVMAVGCADGPTSDAARSNDDRNSQTPARRRLPVRRRRYALYAEPTNPHVCHCRMCQKAFGSYFAPFAGVPPGDFAWEGARPASSRARSWPSAASAGTAARRCPSATSTGTASPCRSAASTNPRAWRRPNNTASRAGCRSWPRSRALPGSRTEDRCRPERMAQYKSRQHPDTMGSDP